jgi:hypothetical protein
MIRLSSSPERLVAFNSSPESRIDSKDTVRVSKLKGKGSNAAKVSQIAQKNRWMIRNHGEPNATEAQSDIL